MDKSISWRPPGMHDDATKKSDPTYGSKTFAVVASIVVALIGVNSGCGPAPNKAGTQSPTVDIEGQGPPLKKIPGIFKENTEVAQLDFQYDPGPADDYFFPAIMGGGAGLLDFDRDGDLDIYLVNGNGDRAGAAEKKVRNRLFEQVENGKFRDVTEASGMGDTGYGMGVAIGDINNDGFPDVYVTNYDGDQLYLNQRDGSFKNITAAAGIDNLRWAVSATFLDFDRDGWLDLYVTNYVNFFPGRKCKARDGRADFCSPAAFPGTVDKLYRNTGAASGVRFEDVTVASGVASKRGPGLGVAAADFNADGWTDIYVANDGAANFLWINQHDGTFKDEAVFRGAALDRQGRAQAGMGVATADLNRDGRLDLFVTHLGGESNALYLSSGDEFDEDSMRRGLGVASYGPTGFGVGFVDLENDGDEDVVIVNGRVARRAGAPIDPNAFWDVYAEKNQILLNQGESRFEAVQSDDDDFLAHAEVSRALCLGDIDNDGDVDLLTVNLAGKARLHFNNASDKGHWLMIQVRESKERGGRHAYGAAVRLLLADPGLDGEARAAPMRVVAPGTSYCASNDPRVHFGLGALQNVPEVEVTWPDGAREVFPVGEVDRNLTVTRGGGAKRE